MKTPAIFTGFAITYKRLDKLTALMWRFLRCNHDTPACLDLGDSDHIYNYCFRCHTKV